MLGPALKWDIPSKNMLSTVSAKISYKKALYNIDPNDQNTPNNIILVWSSIPCK